jgi:hypothetical protein
MRSGRRYRTASWLAAWALAVASCCSAQAATNTTQATTLATPPTTAAATVEFSNCQDGQALSPDGKWTLAGNFVDGACPASASKPAQGARDGFSASHANDFGVVLFLEDAASHARRPVAFAGYDGEAAWSPSGEAFFVNDHMGSNVTDSWLYFADSLRRVNVREAVRHADRVAARYLDGHAYFRSRQWMDGHTAMVQLCGHTDSAPSMQFDLRYSVSLDGRAKRISMRVRPITDENFQMECE